MKVAFFSPMAAVTAAANAWLEAPGTIEAARQWASAVNWPHWAETLSGDGAWPDAYAHRAGDFAKAVGVLEHAGIESVAENG